MYKASVQGQTDYNMTPWNHWTPYPESHRAKTSIWVPIEVVFKGSYCKHKLASIYIQDKCINNSDIFTSINMEFCFANSFATNACILPKLNNRVQH